MDFTPKQVSDKSVHMYLDDIIISITSLDENLALLERV